MRILGGHHVSFAVGDLERARGFYEGVLGFAPIERPDFPFPGAWYRVGPIEVHLIVPPEGVDTGAPAPQLTPVAHHAAFEIEDYDAAQARLDREGLAYLGLGREVGQIFVRDPDGNLIELIKPGGRLGRRPAER